MFEGQEKARSACVRAHTHTEAISKGSRTMGEKATAVKRHKQPKHSENSSEHEKGTKDPPVTDGGATTPTVTAHHGALASAWPVLSIILRQM